MGQRRTPDICHPAGHPLQNAGELATQTCRTFAGKQADSARRLRLFLARLFCRSTHFTNFQQAFIQQTLRDVIRSVTKKKKQRPRTVLMAIRNTCADWASGIEPTDDPFLKGDKDLTYKPQDVRNRDCSLGSTQLYMFRTMWVSPSPLLPTHTMRHASIVPESPIHPIYRSLSSTALCCGSAPSTFHAGHKGLLIVWLTIKSYSFRACMST